MLISFKTVLTNDVGGATSTQALLGIGTFVSGSCMNDVNLRR